MDKIDYQIADNFCEEALIELETIHPSVWLVTHKDLFESIQIKPSGLPAIANQNYMGVSYEYIGMFFETYQKKKFEENIHKSLEFNHNTTSFIGLSFQRLIKYIKV